MFSDIFPIIIPIVIQKRGETPQNSRYKLFCCWFGSLWLPYITVPKICSHRWMLCKSGHPNLQLKYTFVGHIPKMVHIVWKLFYFVILCCCWKFSIMSKKYHNLSKNYSKNICLVVPFHYFLKCLFFLTPLPSRTKKTSSTHLNHLEPICIAFNQTNLTLDFEMYTWAKRHTIWGKV